jgi:hypothetical protein
MTQKQVAKMVRKLGIAVAYFDDHTVCTFTAEDADVFANATGWVVRWTHLEAENINDGIATVRVWAVSPEVTYDPMSAVYNNCD